MGFTVNVPGTDWVLNHIFWRDDPPAAQWQPVPTWFQRLRQAGFDARAVLPVLHRQRADRIGLPRGAVLPTNHDDYADSVIQQVRTATGLVYAYTLALDTVAHLFGVGSAEWHAAAAYVDALLTRLVDALPPDAAMMVTADHGGLNVAADARIDLDADPRLSAGVRVVAGETGVRYLHTDPGAAPDVVAAWTELLDGRAEISSRENTVAVGFFGPVRPEHLARFGDVVVICRDGTAVLAGRREPPEVAQLVGMHGGATPVEIAIPLITFRG